MANSVDSDQTPRFVAASDLGLHCLLMSVSPNILLKVNTIDCTMNLKPNKNICV